MAERSGALLVDTTGFVFRAFHALRDTVAMRRDDGHPTGAIYVTLNMLIRTLQKHPAERIACVMDAKGKTFRHDMYPEYKANRPPMDPDLAAQIEPIKRFISAMGIHVACVSGVEADDVIATLHAKARSEGQDVTIASADKDLMQLVDERTAMIDNLRSEERRYGPKEVEEKYGVAPHQIVDFLALTGDSSDNIKGVEKVGPKTAAAWLKRYGSLDGVIGHAAEIKGVVGGNLRDAIDRVRDNVGLVKVKEDVELGFGLEDLAPRPPDEQALRDLCAEYQMRFADRLLRVLQGEAKASAPSASGAGEDPDGDALPRAERLADAAALAAWLKKNSGGDGLGMHVRYRKTGESPLDDEWEDLALASGSGARCWMHLHGEPPELAAAAFAALAESGRAFALADSKRLLNGLARKSLPAPELLDDVGLIGFVANSHQDVSLPGLARRLLDMSPPEPPAGVEPLDPAEAERGRADSGGWSALAAALARKALKERLAEEEWEVYGKIDRPLVPVLARMERAGILVDAKRLEELTADLAGRMERTESEIREIVGKPFNLGSPQQVAEALFDEMRLPTGRKTQKGARSTDESVLGDLARNESLSAEQRRVPELILEHRAVSKLRSTYTQRLPEWIHPEDGRVHTHFSQIEAATGRLASSRPNLQNIPIRTEDGRRIRRSFVARDGCVLVSADYSQVELRLMAHMSGDPGLVGAFARGEDVHRATAAEVFGVAPGEVDADQRRYAKSINFGLIYGMSEFGLARQLGISREEARSRIGTYFDRYPRVREFMDEMRVASEQDRFVRTLFGRRVHSPRAVGYQARQAAQRAAINAPIQGSAADIIKRAMAEIDAWIEREGVGTRMLLQVHDELLLEAPLGEVDAVCERVPAIMSAAGELSVPLVVDVGKGANWDEAH